MKNKITATLGAMALAATLTSTAEAAIVSQPCETCGLAVGAPLPEGFFVINLTDYGRRDNQGAGLGANIPFLVWSTPFSFYNTRLEVVAAIPNTFTDGGNPRLGAAGALNRVDMYSQALLFFLAYDFGNGFNAAVSAGPRSPDNFTHGTQGAIADFKASVSYVKDGYNATLTFSYGGNLGGLNRGVANGFSTGNSFDDNIFVDYTLTKKFGKFELGIVGYAVTDIGGPISRRPGSVAVGGLVGYDFGKFTLQAYATRDVAQRYGGQGLGAAECAATAGAFACQQKDTRGYVRVIVPLYVAPAPAAPVVAKY